jgi:hypothetical protein
MLPDGLMNIDTSEYNGNIVIEMMMSFYWGENFRNTHTNLNRIGWTEIPLNIMFPQTYNVRDYRHYVNRFFYKDV